MRNGVDFSVVNSITSLSIFCSRRKKFESIFLGSMRWISNNFDFILSTKIWMQWRRRDLVRKSTRNHIQLISVIRILLISFHLKVRLVSFFETEYVFSYHTEYHQYCNKMWCMRTIICVTEDWILNSNWMYSNNENWINSTKWVNKLDLSISIIFVTVLLM